MTSSKTYQLKLSGNFQSSYQKIIRNHYRKNPQARESFENSMRMLLRGISHKPRLGPPHSHREPWPKKSFREGWELWKFNFGMPGLEGAAGQGRLMYLVHEESSTVHPLWVYTHDEFEGRPAEKDLQKTLRSTLQRPNAE